MTAFSATEQPRAGQSYDSLNRLSTKAPASQPTVTTTYDLAGRVLTVADSAGTFTYGYDTAGRNTAVTRPDTKVVSYQYDANSNRTRVTWPDAVFVTYSYDQLNRMSELRQGGTTLLAKYDWDALSRRSKITFGNNTTASYAYRANDDLATIVHQLKTSAVTFTYNYNQAGQRTQTAVTDDRYLFRPAANETVDYAANALNQYTLVNSAAITYDSKGNLTGDGVGTFAYDTENRMTGATVPGKVATYAYDPMGRRKSKTVNGVVTSYLHDGDREIAEYDGSGGLLRRYVYGVNLDEPLLQITAAGTKFYYRADGLGSIVAHEEHSSGFVQRFGYGAFGETTAATGHPFRYTARRIDEETGLYYYRARMYSPALGRFMQTDPIGYEGGINLYAYVENDPLSAIDPLGLNTYFLQSGASLVGLVGGVFNVGIYYTTENKYGLPDIGVFKTTGPAVGIGAGVSITGGYAKGSISEFRGRTLNIDASASILTGSVSFAPSPQGVSKTFSNYVGASGGLSIGTPGFDLSSTTTKAGGLTENVFIPAIDNVINSINQLFGSSSVPVANDANGFSTMSVPSTRVKP